MTRDELLAELTAERYTNTWWPTPEPEPDDDVTARRRVRAMVEDFDRVDARQKRRA